MSAKRLLNGFRVDKPLHNSCLFDNSVLSTLERHIYVFDSQSGEPNIVDPKVPRVEDLFMQWLNDIVGHEKEKPGTILRVGLFWVLVVSHVPF